MNDFEDRELDLEELSEVNGGLASYSSGVIAYCKSCNSRLKDLGTERINGGTTNIFICTNKKCKEYNKRKNNLQVKWP